MSLTLTRPEPIAPAEAEKLIRGRKAPAALRVDGTLTFRDDQDLKQLPAGLQVRRLLLQNCANLQGLPHGLRVRHLELLNCPRVTALPAGLHCYELLAAGSNLTTLPADLRVDYRIDLSDSRRLTHLPVELKSSTLILRGCTALAALPEGLDVCFLDLQGCAQLAGWPQRINLQIGRLNLSGCARIRSLPPGLQQLAQLDLSNCPGLDQLPEGLQVSSWIDVAGTGLTGLPASLRGTRLRWHGVAVSERIAFHPESLTVPEILQEPNAEVRRVMLERVGFEWFVQHARAEVLDRDRDCGGERRLLHIALENDEPLVCVSLVCPSTGRQYVLRVPPTMHSCRQAVAWMAGFDDPNDYHPLVES